MKKFISKIGLYSIIGIFVVPFSIVSHELGHFLAYIGFGVEGVVLRSASVSADKSALTSGQVAFAAAVGPVITYVSLVAAGVLLRYKYLPFLVIIGLAAPLGRIVNFVYIYLRAAGYQPNPNFDEFNFARAVGIDPLFVAIPTAVAVIVAIAYFGRRAFKHGGWLELAMTVVGVAVGLGVWLFVGPRLLP
ncbi:MAG: hypothetical protein IPM21_12905 [Acidobacteria bacterium]|nr:hypothetical protein [Acidobacteriota bacterium]